MASARGLRQAEALAFGTLLLSGTPVRLTGQDTRRGHVQSTPRAFVDTRTELEYVALEHLAPGQARCEIYNSTLSEAGVLGFEYGYSGTIPKRLSSGRRSSVILPRAQVIIDPVH